MVDLAFDGELLLAGGGGAEDSWALDERLVTHIGEGAAMGYIPVAMPPERYPDCEEWITSVFTQHGLADIRMWTELTEIDSTTLTAVSAVYIGGGNTYRLLHELRQTGMDRLLREFVAEGGVLYGGSAGAIVCGETIETTSDENHVNLSDTTGLGFLPDTDIWCHYTDDHAIHNYVAETNHTVVAVPERSGISVTAAGVPLQVVGRVPISIFTPCETIMKSPGEQYRL